jgi:transcriptional regulator with XRE-family HTH domain
MDSFWVFPYSILGNPHAEWVFFLATRMSTPPTDRVRGELLREWRVSQRCDVTVLASRANLSVAQILQLESGGSSLFYTPAIKENAARKVANLLGGDPTSVIRPMDDVPWVGGPSVVEELVELSRQRAQAAQAPSVFARPPRWLLGSFLTMGLLVVGAAWLQNQVPDGGGIALWQASTSFLAPAPQHETAPVVSPMPLPKPAAAAVAVTLPVSLAGPAEQIPFAAEKASSGNDLCQTNQAAAVVLKPASPSKAGDMVYVVAQKSGAICVVDGAGRSTVLSLQLNESRSVYGSAPWRVHFEQPEQAQLYFQGVRLRLPDASVTTVALQEGVRSR